MPDIILQCVSCKKDFTFKEDEQEWMIQTFGNDYVPPKHCIVCRYERRKKKRQQEILGQTQTNKPFMVDKS